MDDALRQLDPTQGAGSIEALTAPQGPVLIQQEQADGPLEHHEALKARPWAVPQMAVRPHIGAGLHHIEEALHGIGLRMEVVVAPQPGQRAGLGRQPLEQAVIDPLDLLSHNRSGRARPRRRRWPAGPGRKRWPDLGWAPHQGTLHLIRSLLQQEQPLILRFQPRGDSGKTKGRGQRDDGGQNGGATGIAEAGAREESIDLEAIDQQGSTDC